MSFGSDAINYLLSVQLMQAWIRGRIPEQAQSYLKDYASLCVLCRDNSLRCLSDARTRDASDVRIRFRVCLSGSTRSPAAIRGMIHGVNGVFEMGCAPRTGMIRVADDGLGGGKQNPSTPPPAVPKKHSNSHRIRLEIARGLCQRGNRARLTGRVRGARPD